jgi:hypothetical protein
MMHKREVGCAPRWDAESPAHVGAHSEPARDVKGRVGEDEVDAEVEMEGAREAVRPVGTEARCDAAQARFIRASRRVVA